MNGLDKIIKKIESDSQEACRAMISEAELKAKEILSAGEKNCEEIKKREEIRCETACADVRARAKSAAELEIRKGKLLARQTVISDMLEKSKNSLKNLDKEEYFSLILKMVGKYSEKQDGIIVFSKKDTDRMDKNFISKINKVSAGKLTLGEPDRKIDSGFVLVYGDIEINCTFDTIFTVEKEKLTDVVSAVLFDK